MGITDNSAQVATAQIADLRKKLEAMRKNYADFFTRRDQLTASIADGREQIAKAKAAKNENSLAYYRESVSSLLDTRDKMTTPPGGEDSVQYKAIQQRIADLEAQIAEDSAQSPYHEEYTTAAKAAADKARAIRQAAVAASIAAESATADKLAADAEVARLRRIDGVA